MPTLVAAVWPCTALVSTSDCVSIDTDSDSIDIKLSDVSTTVEHLRSSTDTTGTLLCILCDTQRYSDIIGTLGEVANNRDSDERRGEDLLCIIEDLRTEWCSRLCWLSGYFVYQYVKDLTGIDGRLIKGCLQSISRRPCVFEREANRQTSHYLALRDRGRRADRHNIIPICDPATNGSHVNNTHSQGTRTAPPYVRDYSAYCLQALVVGEFGPWRSLRPRPRTLFAFPVILYRWYVDIYTMTCA